MLSRIAGLFVRLPSSANDNMVDWNDPHVLALCIRAYTLLVHVVAGIYFWEFSVTLNFDWRILRGKRPRNLGALLYLLPRYSCLVTAIIAVRVTNAIGPLNCQAYITISFSSALLYARVWALSEGNPFVVWVLGFLYLGNWAMVVYGVYFSYGQYFDTFYICAAINLTPHRWNALYQLIFDLACLADPSGIFSFNRPGLLYFVAIAIVYALHLTFLSAQMNPAVAQMPSVLRVVAATIAVTRMQRGLIDFVEKRPVITSGGSVAGAFSREETLAPTVKPKGFPDNAVYAGSSYRGLQISVNVDTWQERQSHFDEDVFPMNKMDKSAQKGRSAV
ncbi:hypothetical protein BKA62DRAFT_792653 [Auriculariales sp. MPI-PUGE-AT-0066]|nr:hypothetical protein BKA62DRAFT_792653 [Auriculariales sp. MPI-PUGE-AT-0066]